MPSFILPRPLRTALLLVAAFAALQPAYAQTQRGLDDDRPQVVGARKPKKPEQKPPRAISVFEWAPAAVVKTTVPVAGAAIGSDAPPSLQQARGSAASLLPSLVPTPQQGVPSTPAADKPAAARVVPVSVFWQGQFQDGGVYLAEPSPLALGAGDIYAAEHAGDPLGFLTIRDSSRVNGSWLGFASWELLTPGTTAVQLNAAAEKQMRKLDPKADAALESDTDLDDDRPTLRKHKVPVKGKVIAPQEVKIPNPADDPDRPRLKHKSAEQDTTLPELIGNPAGLRQTVAVSDSSMIDEHVFVHAFQTPADAAAAQKQMQQLAASLLARLPQPAAAAPVSPSANRRGPRARNMHRAAIPRGPAFENVQFGAYDLSFQDEPAYVFAAQTAPGPHQQFVAVIARPDIYGKLQVAWSAVTSATELSITPRYRLVDAVDADGDGRAEVLMEARNTDGRRFVLFQVYRGVATQIFQTELIP